MQELLTLLSQKNENCPEWIRGRIPSHYRRVSVDRQKLLSLARFGAARFIAAYPESTLYFTQSVIAGAMLSGEYDRMYIITPSQYGKAIEKDCPVLTRSGWKTHGELTTDDWVIGLDGKWKKVTYVHPDCVMDRIVTFSDGTTVKCHHNHTWIGADRNNRRWREIPTDEMVGRYVPYINSLNGDKKNLTVYHRHVYRKVVSVEKIDDGTIGNCITVDGGVYCIGRNLIPTHNSWLMGRLALLWGYGGMPVYVAGAAGNTSDIIMRQVDRGLLEIDKSIQEDITSLTKSQLERLNRSISKETKRFKSGGFVEGLSLGETYSGDTSSNKAVGRGGAYIVDEAALLSEDTIIELGRSEYARTDGGSYPIVMISNPHKPGYFYDHMIEDDPDERTLIIWMDVLTAVEEGRWDINKVIKSDFAKNTSRRRVYLLCELDTVGGSMFTQARVVDKIPTNEYTQYFLGVDAAYRGKDDIRLGLITLGDTGQIGVKECVRVEKGEWIDGVTSEDIIQQVTRVCRGIGVALVCVDIGYGVWLTEGLIKNGINAVGINFAAGCTKERVQKKHYAATNGANVRAEMHLDLQNLMDDGNIVFEKEAYDSIKDVLPFVTAERRASGKIQIRPKSEIKALLGHSPDALDSILLGIHALILSCGESLGYIT